LVARQAACLCEELEHLISLLRRQLPLKGKLERLAGFHAYIICIQEFLSEETAGALQLAGGIYAAPTKESNGSTVGAGYIPPACASLTQAASKKPRSSEPEVVV